METNNTLMTLPLFGTETFTTIGRGGQTRTGTKVSSSPQRQLEVDLSKYGTMVSPFTGEVVPVLDGLRAAIVVTGKKYMYVYLITGFAVLEAIRWSEPETRAGRNNSTYQVGGLEFIREPEARFNPTSKNYEVVTDSTGKPLMSTSLDRVVRFVPGMHDTLPNAVYNLCQDILDLWNTESQTPVRQSNRGY